MIHFLQQHSVLRKPVESTNCTLSCKLREHVTLDLTPAAGYSSSTGETTFGRSFRGWTLHFFLRISDDEDIPVKTTYAPVRKKLCPKRDDPFLPITRTLHFTPTLRCEPQRRSPLRPIPEDELPQSRVKDTVPVDTSEVKLTEFRKPSSHTAKTIFPWTPVWLQDEDATQSTSRRIIPPILKSSSKQKLDAGSNKKKELQIQRSLSVKGTSEIQPRQCSRIINHRNQIKNTKPLSFPSKRWKSFSAEESFRMEEKKQYQQLLEHCTSNPSLSASHSISCMSSSSSSSSSPLPCPVDEVKLSKKPSQSIHPVAENVNAIFSPSSEFPGSSESMVSTCEKKDWSMDKKKYSALYKDPGIRTLQSGSATMRNATNKTYKRVESVIKSGKQLDSNEDHASLLQLMRLHEASKNEPVPLIDLASSASGSDSDDVEIVDEFPEGRKRAEAFKSKVESERMKYRLRKNGGLTQATDVKDNEENEVERRKRISQNFYNKVENRMKLLDIISDSKDKGGIRATRVKRPFVLLTPKMLAEVDAALVPVPKSEVLVHKFTIKITRYDIHTLKGLNWLNDEVINFYMSLIVDRSKDNNHLPSTYALNSFFYPTLMTRGHQSVSRWTKKVDIFNYDILLVPIHLGVHWCMATVDFKKKCISYYDSMLSNNNKCLQILLNYLKDEHLDKKKTPYTTTAWNLKNVKDIPEQMNGSDCGVFACQFAEHKSRLAAMDFDQGDMPYFRRRMVYEIINAILLE